MRNQIIFDDFELEQINLKYILFQRISKFQHLSLNNNAQVQTKQFPKKLQIIETSIRYPTNHVNTQTQDTQKIIYQQNFDQQKLHYFIKKHGPIIIQQLQQNQSQAFNCITPFKSFVQPTYELINLKQNYLQFGVLQRKIISLIKQPINYRCFMEQQWNYVSCFFWKLFSLRILQSQILYLRVEYNEKELQNRHTNKFHLDTGKNYQKVCISCISFHNNKPSILAAGSFIGQIFLYDVSKEDGYMIGKSNIDDYLHCQSISKIIWWNFHIQGSNTYLYNILTLSTDGKILLWDTRHDQQRIGHLFSYPIKGFNLLRKKEGEILNVGGLSFSHSKFDKNNFIITSQGGSIFKAILSNIQMKKQVKNMLQQNVGSNIKWKTQTFVFMMNLSSDNAYKLKNHVENYAISQKLSEINMQIIFASKPELKLIYSNPVVKTYDPHFGPVYSVDYSPFMYDLFATCSIDGSIHIYSQKKKQPLICIDDLKSYIFKVVFSPTRPSILAACNSMGQIFFYDIIKSTIVNKIELSLESCYGFSWNVASAQYIGSFHQGGRIIITQLSRELVQYQNNQIELFEIKINQLKNQ